jgi:hypothetical protein
MNFNSIFVFKGKHIFRVKSDEMSLDSDYPKLISEKFATIEGKIDDAIQMADESTLIFQVFFSFQLFYLLLNSITGRKVLQISKFQFS